MFALLALAAIVACVAMPIASIAALVAIFGTHLHRKVREALGGCVVAAAPGLVFVAHLFALAIWKSPQIHQAYDLWSTGPALFAILYGPFFFAGSLSRAWLNEVPVWVDVFRSGLFLGWLTSSWMAILSAIMI